MDVFLKDSFDELNHLQKEGVNVNGVVYKVRVLLATVDTVMRGPLMGLTQFNGAFGCGFCLLEGEWIGKGRGGARIYPESFDENEEPVPLRSLEQHIRDLEEVLRTGKPVHGILGPTPLSGLDGFNYIKGVLA